MSNFNTEDNSININFTVSDRNNLMNFTKIKFCNNNNKIYASHSENTHLHIMKQLFNVISTVTNVVQEIRRQFVQVWINVALCVVASSHRDAEYNSFNKTRLGH